MEFDCKFLFSSGERHMNNDITVCLFQTGCHTSKEISRSAHDFVRQHIARLTDTDPMQLVFGRTKQGKPYVENAGIFFNLSHSNGVVAAAFSPCEIGVDIEAVRPVNLRIAERYFSDCDRRYLAQAVDQEDAFHRFFAMWTAKEAYLKRHGAGLAGGLGFSVADESGLLPIVVSENFPASEMFFRFMNGENGDQVDGNTFKDAAPYCLSLCSDRIDRVFFTIRF